jgi:hypothetical protein
MKAAKPASIRRSFMARVTNKEAYATQNHIEILSQAKLTTQEKTTNTQKGSEIQGIVVNQDEIKAAKDFANAKKSDEQLQATLLKGQLQDTASRLDQFREGDLKGFEKEAKKFGIKDLGVIKDNLGKDIARHEGPGIDDMYKKSKKYEMPDRDPLKGLPKTVKTEKDAKKAPDTPFKDDPNLVSKGVEVTVGKITEVKPDKVEVTVGKITEVKPDKVEVTVGKITFVEPDKPKKYIDPDQIDATKVEKPKDPPPTDHDLIGHKVNPLHHDPIIDTENVDVKKVMAEHKGPKKTQIYTDPDQMQKKAKFDASNPPRIEENELKNTGNPNDFNGVQWELPKGGGDKPHTDGEGGDADTLPQNKVTIGTSGGSSSDKVQLPFVGVGPTGDDHEEDVGPNVPR